MKGHFHATQFFQGTKQCSNETKRHHKLHSNENKTKRNVSTSTSLERSTVKLLTEVKSDFTRVFLVQFQLHTILGSCRSP